MSRGPRGSHLPRVYRMVGCHPNPSAVRHVSRRLVELSPRRSSSRSRSRSIRWSTSSLISLRSRRPMTASRSAWKFARGGGSVGRLVVFVRCGGPIGLGAEVVRVERVPPPQAVHEVGRRIVPCGQLVKPPEGGPGGVSRASRPRARRRTSVFSPSALISGPSRRPCTTSVASNAQNVRNRINSRCGNGPPLAVTAGIASAAASDTPPRKPVQAMTTTGRQLGLGSHLRSDGKRSLGRYVAGNTHAKRTRMSVRLTSARTR